MPGMIEQHLSQTRLCGNPGPVGKTQHSAQHKGTDHQPRRYHRARILRRRKNAVISSNRPMIMKSEAGVAVRGR